MSALSDEIRLAVAAEVAPLQAEIRALRVIIESRDSEQLLDSGDLARLFGCSPRAMRARLRRPGNALAPLSREVDGHRVWLRRDVEAVIARGKRK